MNHRKNTHYVALQQFDDISTEEIRNGDLMVSLTGGREMDQQTMLTDPSNAENEINDDELLTSYRGPNSKGNNFKQRVNKWLRSLSNLEKLLSILVVVLAFIVILQASISLSHSGSERNALMKNCTTRSCVEIAGMVALKLNEEIDPCDDFYEFSCGGWKDNNPLPSGYSKWSSFNILAQKTQLVLKRLLETNRSSDSVTDRKSKIFFNSCLDLNKINDIGAQPLLNILAKVFDGWSLTRKWDNYKFDFNKTLLRLIPYSTFPFFVIGVDANPKNSSSNVVMIEESALDLGNRDYYINKTVQSDKILSAYWDYMTEVGVLLGGERNDTRSQMLEILLLEQELAKHCLSMEEMRNEEETFRKLKLKDFPEIFPEIDWLTLVPKMFKDLANLTITPNETIVTNSLKFLSSLSTIYKNTPARVISNYLSWRFANSLVGSLGQPFIDARNTFHKVRYGSDRSCVERWRYCVEDVEHVLGLALGKLYVENTFDQNSKKSAEDMVKAIKMSFNKELHRINWMDDITRGKASKKSDAVNDMIGFPDEILNATYISEKYEDLIILENGTYFGYYINYILYLTKRELKLLRKPVKRDDWLMNPQTINAYYSTTQNVIVFPAGILQSPFYGSKFPMALNFGGIGVVVGHELTHGFDDQGRQYDLNGNLQNWWENDTLKRFQKETECMIEQYNQYKQEGENINGNLTIGENIADNAGLRLSFMSYQNWRKTNGSVELDPVLPSLNYTHDQLFYIAFAQLWCAVSTKQYDQQQILTDVHSPAKYRVIGTVSNSKGFADAFKCKPGSPMNPVNKCKVW